MEIAKWNLNTLKWMQPYLSQHAPNPRQICWQSWRLKIWVSLLGCEQRRPRSCLIMFVTSPNALGSWGGQRPRSTWPGWLDPVIWGGEGDMYYLCVDQVTKLSCGLGRAVHMATQRLGICLTWAECQALACFSLVPDVFPVKIGRIDLLGINFILCHGYVF